MVFKILKINYGSDTKCLIALITYFDNGSDKSWSDVKLVGYILLIPLVSTQNEKQTMRIYGLTIIEFYPVFFTIRYISNYQFPQLLNFKYSCVGVHASFPLDEPAKLADFRALRSLISLDVLTSKRRLNFILKKLIGMRIFQCCQFWKFTSWSYISYRSWIKYKNIETTCLKHWKRLY